MSVGATIRDARESAGLTQAELADRVFGDPGQQSNISKLERGDSSPTYATLQRIADALDMDLVVEFRERE